jgi:LysR family hydrogen peroxide-inducible transcriptional activator
MSGLEGNLALPTVKQLRYLIALADSLHFRRAAEVLHVTQPTLSAQLQELEQRLGVQLVERSRSGVLMTATGEEIAGRARLVLQDIEDIVDLARQEDKPFSGLLRLGVLASLGPYLLPHILPELHRAYPELKLYVREGMPEDLLQALMQGNLDLLMHPVPVPENAVSSLRLFREPLVVALAREHPLAAKSTIRPGDLKGETILALEKGHRLHDQVRVLCEQFGATLSLDFEGTSLDTLRQMVAMGMGLTFLPALYVRSEIAAAGDVVVRSLGGKAPARTVGMIWRRQSARSTHYEALGNHIRDVVAGNLPEVTVLS